MGEFPKIHNTDEIPGEAPQVIENAINVFKQLPGIGDRTARRIIYWLLGQPGEKLEEFISALEELKNSVKICSVCFNVSITDPCHICANPERDHSVICVVAEPQDIAAIESTRIYDGVYHVLGGLLDAMRGIGPEDLHIAELVQRAAQPEVKEIILALDPSNEGETTARHIAKLLKDVDVKVTILAQGISAGTALEFADPRTLSAALTNRTELK